MNEVQTRSFAERLLSVFGIGQSRAVSVPPNTDLSTSWSGWVGSSIAGPAVDADSAMRFSVVYACVNVLAQDVASLPLILYRRTAGGKERATNHPLYTLLHDLPNPEMTSVEYLEAMLVNLLLRGNCYAELELNGRGDVVAMWPLRADRMSVSRDTDPDSQTYGGLVYTYELPAGSTVRLPAYRVHHIRGLSPNGVIGFSPIAQARNSIGLGMAAEEFGSRFFSNGATPQLTLQHPGKLGDKAYEHLKTSWQNAYGGLSNAQRVAILEEGMKVEKISISPEDAQFLETRKFQRTDIAGLYRVPPHKIGDLDRATFSNIEQQSLDYITNSLRTWIVRIEKAILRDLVGVRERSAIFAEFLVDGLLRGDIASRYNAYSIGRNGGWLSVDDIRRMENMNTLPDGDGDVYLVPLNMQAAGGSAESEQEPEPAPANDDAQRGLMIVVRDAAQRITHRCQDRNERKHREWFIDVMMPVVRALTLDDSQAEERTIRLVRFWFDNPDADAEALAKRVVIVCT